MAGNGGDDPGRAADAQRYWQAWADAVKTGGGAGGAQAPLDWSQAMGWWRGVLGESVPADAQGPVDRASGPAADWLGLMQQVAARFAGRDTSSAEVAGAWREAVEGQREQLLQWTLGALRGGVAGGFDPWLQQAAQTLEQWQRDSAPWLDMPAFGLGRNHQSRWQSLGKLQQDYQARSQAYLEQLRAALDRAFGVFEAKLSEHEALGSQLTSARAMFDLWIEAAEEAYATTALSEEFGEIYGAFANAHMRLRAALQREAEEVASQYGLPTRSEMDAAHRRIAELERSVRRLLAAQAAGQGAAVAPAAPARTSTPKPAPKATRSAKAADKPAPRAADKAASAGKTGKAAPARKPGGSRAR